MILCNKKYPSYVAFLIELRRVCVYVLYLMMYSLQRRSCTPAGNFRLSYE